jgi:hypothetical protein
MTICGSQNVLALPYLVVAPLLLSARVLPWPNRTTLLPGVFLFAISRTRPSVPQQTASRPVHARADYLADKDWVCAFEKPKGNPAALIRPATTVLRCLDRRAAMLAC